MGKCFEALLLGSVGFGLGVLVYAILGELGAYYFSASRGARRLTCAPTDLCSHAADSPTGQGFVFAIWVYLAALVRFGGPKYISFYLVRRSLALQ